jgi:tripartite-type tricarboxylate transporter receptor subunit TctC
MNFIKARAALTLAAGVAIGALTSSAPAQTQPYPSKPIRLIVPFAPGASTDMSARIMAEALGPILGQPVVVENRPGAGGMNGIEYVAKSAPDGYTLAWPSADPMVMVPAVRKTMPYKVPEDFSYIAKFAETGFAIAISSRLPAKTLAEFIAYAKANPGSLTYGSSGVGGSAHLSALLFEKYAGVKMTHAPYKGGALALNDLLGGHIDVFLATPSLLSAHIGSDKIRILAITSSERHPLLPNVPTMKEVGLPEVTFASWFAVVGPAKMPEDVQDRLRKGIEQVVAQSAVREKVINAAIQLAPAFGKDFEKLVVHDLGAFKALAQAEKISVDD